MKKYLIVLTSFICLTISAQDIHTGYFSNAFLLQSSANPATFSEANFVIGVPGISNGSFGIQWPLSLSEILKKGEDDSLRISLPFISDNLQEKNAFSMDIRNQIFHLGMKVGAKKNVFIYVGDELVVNTGLQFSNELINYFTKGNANFIGQELSFEDEKFEITAYNSLYLGSAVKVNEALNVGARIKFLRGIANVHTEKMNLGFFTDSTSLPLYATTLSSDVMIQTSGYGAVEDTVFFDPMLNQGFAFDVGASYQYNDQLLLSFALNDIGQINWAEENNEYYTTGGEVTFTFEGLTQTSSGAEDLQAQMEEITDSLINVMQPYKTTGSYTTKLAPNLFLGAEYALNDKHHLSLLYHRRKKIDAGFNVLSLGYQYQMSKSFQLLASYQNLSGINNIGTGFVWSPGALQLHMIVDNMMVADVFDAKNLSFQMGLSLFLGKAKKES